MNEPSVTNIAAAREIFQNSGETKTIVKIDYGDIERMITMFFTGDEYGRGVMEPYELPCYEEKGNDTSMEVTVEKKKPSDYNLKDIEAKFDAGAWAHYSTRDYLNLLCFHGAILEGVYLIDISW